MKYRKKPVVIEAIQINANPDEIKEFVGEACEIEYLDTAYEVGKFRPIIFVTIHTLEGDMEAQEGDYIIKGVKGEFYPCREDIFEETYEKAESEDKECIRFIAINVDVRSTTRLTESILILTTMVRLSLQTRSKKNI